ncbi:hypothetical protein KKD81_00110 [Patescibacteria group bacterium]|nr:hypothetical protein [Patescibacteria group bacterium]MBU2158706.1 hypothetical protein [Patescibacteria group bacterium]MBU2220324.1 hypothetical protein [Patescibacteria group bacterium]
MHTKQAEIGLSLLFVLIAAIYYSVPLGIPDSDRIFVTISTFFFSIFTGFFISRQGARYTKIREAISSFDGKLSSTYRAAGNISAEVQEKIGAIIRAHYVVMLEQKQWDYHFIKKSNTISSSHQVLEEMVGSLKMESLRNQAIGRVLNGLADCQVLRKNMIMLYQERIPPFQWFLILFFLLMLVLAISAIPSTGLLLGSILKAAFIVSLISVVVILRNLENFHLFEEFIGERSAQDVIDIIDHKK